MPGLPAEGVEAMLTTFQSLAGADGASDGARILREVSGQCSDAGVRERLLRAAAAMEAGAVCAVVPAAAASITLEQWEAQGGDPVWVEPADTAEEEEDEEEYMEEIPPAMPPLSVSQYFSGLWLRARNDFTALNGRTICEGRVLSVLSCEPSENGFKVSFVNERSLLLDSGEFFSPVPSVECLFSLWELLDRRLAELDDDEQMDEIICDVDDCGEWLQAEPRGAAPECASAPLVGRVFRREKDLSAWVRFLFAGVGVLNK